MKITVLGSDSNGNCYILEENGEILIIEAGVHIQDIQKALNFDFKRVNGCLVSHVHEDHFKSVGNLLSYGVSVFSHEEVCSKANHYSCYQIDADQPFQVGNFMVMAFDLIHDVKNYGYIIKTPLGKKIIFCTDTQFIQKRFKDVSVYMVECNFDLVSMNRAVHSGRIPAEVLIRTSSTHMSLETVLAYLKNADLSNTDHIMLIHLSANNSNAEKYVKTVQDETGIKTIAADKGDVVEVVHDYGF